MKLIDILTLIIIALCTITLLSNAHADETLIVVAQDEQSFTFTSYSNDGSVILGGILPISEYSETFGFEYTSRADAQKITDMITYDTTINWGQIISQSNDPYTPTDIPTQQEIYDGLKATFPEYVQITHEASIEANGDDVRQVYFYTDIEKQDWGVADMIVEFFGDVKDKIKEYVMEEPTQINAHTQQELYTSLKDSSPDHVDQSHEMDIIISPDEQSFSYFITKDNDYVVWGDDVPISEYYETIGKEFISGSPLNTYDEFTSWMKEVHAEDLESFQNMSKVEEFQKYYKQIDDIEPPRNAEDLNRFYGEFAQHVKEIIENETDLGVSDMLEDTVNDVKNKLKEEPAGTEYGLYSSFGVPESTPEDLFSYDLNSDLEEYRALENAKNTFDDKLKDFKKWSYTSFGSPLVFSTDGDPCTMFIYPNTANPWMFDLYNNKMVIPLDSLLCPNTELIFFDYNDNGIMDNGREMMYNPEGIVYDTMLDAFDSDGNGVLNDQDILWKYMKVINSNYETMTIDERGITSIKIGGYITIPDDNTISRGSYTDCMYEGKLEPYCNKISNGHLRAVAYQIDGIIIDDVKYNTYDMIIGHIQDCSINEYMYQYAESNLIQMQEDDRWDLVDETINLYNSISERCPDKSHGIAGVASVHHKLATQENRIHNIQMAKSLYNEAILLEPKSFYYTDRATANFQLGDYVGANNDIDTSLQLNPDNIHAKDIYNQILVGRLR